MSHASPPPLVSTPRDSAARAIARAVALAKVSGLTMLVLGGISLAISITAPLSAGFAISLAVVLNGWIEMRLGRRLKALVPSAPIQLAWNQLAVGLEIAAYAWWQTRVFGPEQVDALLQRPLVASVLEVVPREMMQELLGRLPGAVDLLYGVVGAGAFLGCAITAWYYGAQSRPLRVLASGGPPTLPSRSP